MSSTFASTTPVALLPDHPDHAAIAVAATAPVLAASDQRVTLRIERMDTLGPWAFVQGRLEAPEGGRPDYTGTAFAERAAQGGMSDLHVALLRRDDEGAWMLVDHAIGPADVAWLTWPTTHAAPRQLFGF
ncbi:hypothetical protein CO641_01095 [Lysobacteraceae bacterium NML91-0213]|nr:hypothetical protein CO641_01095 [Xanthomonadaceae bacterium NML91-0213]